MTISSGTSDNSYYPFWLFIYLYVIPYVSPFSILLSYLSYIYNTTMIDSALRSSLVRFFGQIWKDQDQDWSSYFKTL